MLPGDLADRAYCRALIGPAVSAMGGLDAVANDAGKQLWSSTPAELIDAQFMQTYAANVSVFFWIVNAALPRLEPGSTISYTASLEAYSPSASGADEVGCTESEFDTCDGELVDDSFRIPQGARQSVELRDHESVLVPSNSQGLADSRRAWSVSVSLWSVSLWSVSLWSV